MGAILEGVEALKTPTGIIVLLVVVGAAYLWYKWVFQPDQNDKK